jgi:hypothetical protein
MSRHRTQFEPLYRKVNTRARNVRHNHGGDFRHERNTIYGKGHNRLVHVHIGNPDWDGSRWRSYPVSSTAPDEEFEPGTASAPAMKWACPVGRSPCPGQVVWFHRPDLRVGFTQV